ncbi:MAG: hypothetical protein E7218_04315 [Anaerofustis stercorihominis]|nr:hypothetical protein [Anaerofustis stercorihominis]
MKSKIIAADRLKSTISRDRTDCRNIDTDSLKDDISELISEFLPVEKHSAKIEIKNYGNARILTYTVEII